MTSWILVCFNCGATADQHAAVGLCPACGQPLMARYGGPAPSPGDLLPRWDMWRYAPLMALDEGEAPVSLGEGLTPLAESPSLARRVGVRRLLVKDEGVNPTASFKARGLSAAVTRAKARGVPGLVVPTAGNAGAALAAYGVAAHIAVRVYAPQTTPEPILHTIRALGVELVTVDGHIGDAGRLSAAFSTESGFFNVATLREPYRVEGNKTLGLEIAEQLGWRFPDVIVYPTGGGEGVIGIWKALRELQEWGWVEPGIRLPRIVVAQAEGCAPLVKALEEGSARATPWENPVTHAAGLRVPGPLGDVLVLRAVRDTGGDAGAASENDIRHATRFLAAETGIDAAPEGGCALAVLEALVRAGRVDPSSEVVLYNTGSGASYRA